MMKKIVLALSAAFLLHIGANAQVGIIDPDFNLGTGFGPDQWTGKCEAIVQQSDGKLVVGGQFETFNGDDVIYITRLNMDGTRDQNFSSPLVEGWGNSVNAIEIQGDGKILIGGNFNLIGEQAQLGIARLNSDGSVDQSFVAPTNVENVSTFALQPDGKIVLDNLTRLNADGSLDATFDIGTGISGGTGFGGVRINVIAVQPDGKILIGGHFGNYDGSTALLLARLNSDGSIDNTFNANANFSAAIDGFYGQVYAMELLPDGKIMIGGNYGNTNSLAFGVDRLNSDGSLDPSFVVTHSFSNIRNYAMDVQSDGKIFVANVNFGAPNEAFVIERYNTDGSLDSNFPQNYVNNDVRDLIIQADGDITFVGYFNYNPTGIMRLIGDTPLNIEAVDNVAFDFKIHPNPATDLITLVNVPVGSALRITDVTGKTVYSSLTYNELTTINTTDYENGIYIVKVENNGEVASSRLMINN